MPTRKLPVKKRQGCALHGKEKCDICTFVCEICETPDDCAVGACPCSLCYEYIAGPKKGQTVKAPDHLLSDRFEVWGDDDKSNEPDDFVDV